MLQEMEHVSHSKSKSLNMKFYDVAAINNISLSLTHLFIENLTSYRAECDNMGGTKDGTCADGFGICCIGIIWIENNNIIGFEFYRYMFIRYYTWYWFFNSDTQLWPIQFG